MEDYKPNSRASKKVNKEEVKKEKIEKIVKGTVKSKKKNAFLSLFVSDDVADIKGYVIFDVLIPAAKRAISDAITNGIDMMFYGETGKTKKTSASSRISYREYYDRDDRERNRDRSRSRSSRTPGYSYDDVILETRVEADDVINRLEELIDVYGMASVADLYDLVGISGQYTDNKYGWTDVCSATHVSVRDGFLLKMPKVMPL